MKRARVAISQSDNAYEVKTPSRRWFRRASAVRQMSTKKAAYTALREVRELKAQRETKMLTTSVSNQEIDDGTTKGTYVGQLTSVAQGDGQDQRDGFKISVSSLHVKGFMRAATGPCIVPVSIVQDTQQVSDSVPGYTDIFNGSGELLAMPLRESLSISRFKVLRQTTIVVSPVTASGDNPNTIVPFSFYIKFPKGLPVEFNGSANTDIQKNGLYICCANWQPSINSYAVLSFHFRLNYTDA